MTVYEVISAPLAAGADQDSTTAALPTTPTGAAGADGTAAGVMGADARDGSETPAELEAVTVKV